MHSIAADSVRVISDGTVLMHTTSGDLLRRVEGPDRVSLLLMSRECVVFVLYGNKHIQTLSTTARQLDEIKSTVSAAHHPSIRRSVGVASRSLVSDLIFDFSHSNHN